MMLLCGIPSEPPLRMVIEAAYTLGIDYVLLNQRESYCMDIGVQLRDGRVDGMISIRDTTWELGAFSGVYVRLMDPCDLPENKSHGRLLPDRSLVDRSLLFHEALSDWLEMTECYVMNRPNAGGSNISKPYQAQFITRAGFLTPATLVTNDPDEVKRFLSTYKRVVYKSQSSVRSIVQEWNDSRLKDLEKVRFLPTQFQAFVPGTNVRVHVVGNAVFATEIHTNAVDYRYAAREGFDVSMVEVELPSEIATRCQALASSLGLPLCGIDLKRSPEGEYYCFEVNPSPAYSYYEEQTGQPIARSIVNYLEGFAG